MEALKDTFARTKKEGRVGFAIPNGLCYDHANEYHSRHLSPM
jgi:hypothetical protein